MNKEEFAYVRGVLTSGGYKVVGAKVTPCEVFHASAKKVYFAVPEIWSRGCARQGSWYWYSEKSGKYMVMSEERLPSMFDGFLEVQIYESDFLPQNLPTDSDLQELVDSEPYQKQKPEKWEELSIRDRIIFKLVFSLTGFWGKGDNLKKYWLSHRANHANFLCHRYTTRIDSEEVPYSISENKGVCSACAEFFNIIEKGSRKLVRACPGVIISGEIKRDIYYDVKPIKK